MFICKNGNKILSNLPMNDKGYPDITKMEGINLTLEYKKTIYNNVNILKLTNDDPRRFIISHDGFIKEGGIRCYSFINGNFGGILNLSINHIVEGKEVFICKNGVRFIGGLPSKNGKVDCKSMLNNSYDIEYNNIIYKDIKIIGYINGKKKPAKPATIITEYNGYKHSILANNFICGNIKEVLNIQLNTFRLEGNILYIYGHSETYGDWVALYSGDNVDYVMNNTWSYNSLGYIVNTKDRILLHKVDFDYINQHEIIDHINNNRLDCRKENLRVVDKIINAQNKKNRNIYGVACIVKMGNGYYCDFGYKCTRIRTKLKYDLEEAKIDCLIAQRYLGKYHNEDMFYLLDNLPEDRIQEVEILLLAKIENEKYRQREIIEYEYNIEQHKDYFIINKNDKQILLDCDITYIKNKSLQISNNYWNVVYIKENNKVVNKLHRDLLGLLPNQYKEYNIHVDHVNNNPNDNRFSNLIITTLYSNQCNKQGKGYIKTPSNTFKVTYMKDYKFFDKLIGGIKVITFKTEDEAITEVQRRKTIIDNARVKLNNIQELNKLIEYCKVSDINDLDLGYLYFKNILNGE